MKLANLEATLIKATGPQSFQCGVNMAEAQGVMFLCPTCYKKNGGSVGTHSVIVWWKDPGALLDGNPTWNMTGTGLDNLSLSPSIDLTKSPGGCWHGFVTNGEAT